GGRQRLVLLPQVLLGDAELLERDGQLLQALAEQVAGFGAGGLVGPLTQIGQAIQHGRKLFFEGRVTHLDFSAPTSSMSRMAPRTSVSGPSRGVHWTWQRIALPRRLTAPNVTLGDGSPARQALIGCRRTPTGKPMSRLRKCRSLTSSGRRPQRSSAR